MNLDSPHPSTTSYMEEKWEPTGTPHLQGYFQLSKSSRQSAVKKLLPGAHFEIAQGTVAQNKEYCTKERNYKEYGTASLGANERRHCNKEEACRNILKGHQQKTPTQNLIELYPHYHKEVFALSTNRPNRTSKPKVLYIYGPTGKGKSHNTEEACIKSGQSYYFKPSGTKW